jgi:sphinganine-1-phosphate aldolase
MSKALGEGSHKGWGGVYHHDGSELTQVQNEAWALFNCSNTLYPGTFPGVRKFEAELISMTLGIVHGTGGAGSGGGKDKSPPCVGLLTSGGTESILVAVLAYRNQFRIKHGGNAAMVEDGPIPEIIAGVSAHPALTKACHYFGVKLVKVPLDPKTMAIHPDTVEAAITRFDTRIDRRTTIMAIGDGWRPRWMMTMVVDECVIKCVHVLLA